VAKAGRFTEAAKRLNISQSALSRSVALLEEREGVKLLERSKSGVTLTTIGAEVYRHCEQLFQTVSRIESVCRGLQQTCEGPLRFATTDHIINHLLPQHLQAMRNEYPLVLPSIFLGSPDELLQHLLQSEVEFSLSFAKVPAPQVEFEVLKEEPMALVVQDDLWRKTTGGTVTARLNKVLDQHGYISSIGAFAQTRPSRVLRELFGKMPPVGLEVNSQEAQKQICIGGGGVAYLSRFMVAREIDGGQLHEINVEKTHSFNLWLAVRRGHELSVAAKTFIDRLRSAWR
jgi:DNA-binding transcriptional LysR family regulator